MALGEVKVTESIFDDPAPAINGLTIESSIHGSYYEAVKLIKVPGGLRNPRENSVV